MNEPGASKQITSQ